MIVARANRYFRTPFKGYYRVTQWEPLFLTIFKMVVYAVLQNWFTVVASTEETVDPGAAGTERFGRDVQILAE